MTVTVPTGEPVKVTLQLPATRIQGFGVPRLPVPLTIANSTVPAGVLAVPAAVSVTVAVHVEAWLMKTGVVHETAVDVVSRLTVIVVKKGRLGGWAPSKQKAPLTIELPGDD